MNTVYHRIDNEFGFFPYLDTSGNIAENKPLLRDEYKANLFKTAVLYDTYNGNLDGNNPSNVIVENSIWKKKFNYKQVPFRKVNLRKEDINQYFIDRLKYCKGIYPCFVSCL